MGGSYTVRSSGAPVPLYVYTLCNKWVAYIIDFDITWFVENTTQVQCLILWRKMLNSENNMFPAVSDGGYENSLKTSTFHKTQQATQDAQIHPQISYIW